MKCVKRIQSVNRVNLDISKDIIDGSNGLKSLFNYLLQEIEV